MIGSEIALRFAVLGTLFAPALATAQNPTPAENSAQNLNLIIDEELVPYGVYQLFRPGSDARNTEALNRWTRSFDALQANFGLQLAAADDSLRSQLEIPAGQGVVVVGVRPGGLAEQAGFKPNDVILALGEQRVMGVNQARGILLAIGKEAIEVKLIREGKPSRMKLVGPEHGFPPESAEFWIGVPVSPVDPTLRSHLPSLPADSGLIVNDVVAESPAAAAGVLKGDILVSMGGEPLRKPDNLIARIQASGGKPVPLEVVRAGKPRTLTVTPARRAHPTVIQMARPGVEYWLLPEVGVETAPALPGAGRPRDPLRPRTVEPAMPGSRPIDIGLELGANRTRASLEQANARIEAQLRELSAKIDALTRAMDGLGKREAK